MKVIIDDKRMPDDYPLESIIADSKNKGNIILNEENSYLNIYFTDDDRFDIKYENLDTMEHIQTREYISREVFERVIRSFVLGNSKWRKEDIWEPVREKVPKHPWYVGWCVCILIILVVVILAHVFKLNGTQRHDNPEEKMIRLKR